MTARGFDQLPSGLVEQVPAFLGRKRLDELLFGLGQDALEAEPRGDPQSVGVDILGAATHISYTPI